MERVGLIDLGSNNARLTIYDVYEGGYFVPIYESAEKVRLGETEREGNLKQTRVLQAISTVNNFKKICNTHGAKNLIAFATAAVRNAKNQKTFLTDMFAATGIKFTVLSADEEAMHDYYGVVNSIEIPKGVICEIGGGSIKLIQYNRRNVLQKTVLPFGAVTLKEMFFGGDGASLDACIKTEQYVKEQLESVEWLKTLEPDYQFVGVGGSIRSLARIVRKVRRYPLDMVHDFAIDMESFNYIYDMVKGFNLEKASKIKGLSKARADVFPCALAALKALLENSSFQGITCCSCGIREGVMFNYAVPTTVDKPIVDILGHSLQTHIRQWNLEQKHSEQTFNMCIQLFKQLRVLHKFPRAYVRVLRIASMLYEAGKVVKFYDFPRHTSYMIMRSNLYGVSHADIVLASYVCDMYSKEDNLPSEWTKFDKILSPEVLEAAKKLAVILQLAVAFDTSRCGLVSEINCDILGDSVIMKLELEGDAYQELNAAKDWALEFKKIFKKNLEIL